MPQEGFSLYIRWKNFFVSLNTVALGDCVQITICDLLVGHEINMTGCSQVEIFH